MLIRRLPDDLVNRIAAGEVVERPASVVKELVENAIDAGAMRIGIVTAKGGKTLIRITDDGSGMAEADLSLSVERHATSKLPDGQLEDIRSLGFRGEALASIGAVSDLSIRSRPQNQDAGLEIVLARGKLGDPHPVAMNKGTVVEVANLFAAVPARLKFLKSDRAETGAITEIVKRLAMANPEIHFRLEGADRKTTNWTAQTAEHAQLGRLTQIMGADFAGNSTPVALSRHGVVVQGLVGLPTFTRANSLSQFYFVNGRSVRDKVLIGAVRAAFSDFIFRDRFPVVCLFISVEPTDVDVNVHPAKSEVRFRDAGGVRSAVLRAVKEALDEAGFRASSHIGDATLAAFSGEPSPQSPSNPSHSQPTSASWSGQASSSHVPNNPTLTGLNEPSARYDPGPSEVENNNFPLGSARAQLFENYIVAQSEDSLILIDQHAAHERLVYEKFKAEQVAGNIASQAQLIPVVVELPEDDCDRLEAAAPMLEKLGLYLERFGDRAITVRETPAVLGQPDVILLVNDLADGLAEWDNIEVLTKRMEAIIGRMACHGSVRSGRLLRVDEMNALLRQMEATPHSGQCIHGRPTYVELKLADIERLFGRS